VHPQAAHHKSVQQVTKVHYSCGLRKAFAIFANVKIEGKINIHARAAN